MTDNGRQAIIEANVLGGAEVLTILDVIREHADSFSAKQRKLAQYIEANPQQAAFLTSARLAEAAGVSNPTVIRFAAALGYKGYPQMQQHLQALVQQRLSVLDRAHMDRSSSVKNGITDVLAREKENLERCMEQLDFAAAEEAVSRIVKSSTLLVCGMQASEGIAAYAAYTFSKILPCVCSLKRWDIQTVRLLDSCGQDAVALFLYRSRYPSATRQMMEACRERGIPIILITDSLYAPGASLADLLLPLPVRQFSFVDLQASSVSMINLLAHSAVSLYPEETEDRLRAYDRFTEENGVFLNNITEKTPI